VPATHYIVSVQVALLAASAAYLKSDKPAPNVAQAEQGMPAGADWLASIKGFDEEKELKEAGRAGRFALAERTGGMPEVAARSMGFRGGVPVKSRLIKTHAEAGKGAEAQRQMQAAGESEPVPDTPVELSGVGAGEMKFDPVPDGEGYSITADSATNFDLKTRTVVFAGNVSLHCSQFTLSADRLVVHMEKEGASMSQMVANGNVDVKLTQGTEAERYQGSGEEAVYEPKSNRIVFRGWPRILGHGREHRAASATTKMTLFTNPAKLLTEGRAQTRILAGEGGALPGVAAQ
jgi:lipopolysaccharide transport protein LptA